MVQKYLDLESAARRLNVSVDELKQLVQRREIRAFADRGTWKFREQDVEEFARHRSLGSAVEVDMRSAGSGAEDTASDEIQLAEHLLSDAAPGASGARVVVFQDTVGPSDSDVRLVAEPAEKPSDSDVKLVAEGPEAASDSDVQLVEASAAPSDSDVRLAEAAAAQDSGARLQEVPEPPAPSGASREAVAVTSPSDFELAPGGSADTDFEVSLEPSSSGEEDLIDLDQAVAAKPVDVAAAGPSASGVALGSPADSGISLEEPPSLLGERTDAGVADVKALFGTDLAPSPPSEFDSEDLSLAPSTSAPRQPAVSEGSDFDLELSDETAQIPLLEEDSQVIDLEEEGPVDEGAATALAAAPVALEEPVGAGPAAFPGVSPGLVPSAPAMPFPSVEVAAPAAAPAAAWALEPDWPGWTVACMAASSVVLLLCAMVMADLLRTVWGWEHEIFYASPLLEFFRRTLFPS
jgi:excisionase family DNA binding protein